MSNYDMIIPGGGLGGSHGFLDWGSDIARMWGLGMQNGLNMANAMRDAQMRAALDPSYIAATWGQNMVAQQQAQNQYTNAYDQGQADNIRHSTAAGFFDPRGVLNGQGVVNTSPQAMQAQYSVAPYNSSKTAIPNGLNQSGHTNATPSSTGAASTSVSTALNQGLTNQYGYGG